MYKNSLFVKISVVFLLLLWGGKSYSQIGTEFWFDMPEHNLWHDEPSPITGIFLHVASASDNDATVTLEVPAFPAFRFTAHGGNPTYTFTVPAGSEVVVNLVSYMGAGGNTGVNLPDVEPANVLENVLLWAETNTTAVRPYINRTKKGICMKSNYPITSYLEYNGPVNMDLIALKGPNAKGKEFYIPVQTALGNSAYNIRKCPPYSSFNIVATEPDTKIIIKTKQAIWLRSGTTHTDLPAGTHTLWLNRGESSIIAPHEAGQGSSVSTGYDDIAQHPNNRLDGTYVKVATDEGSGGDIVILTRVDLPIGAVRGYEGLLKPTPATPDPVYPSQYGDVDMDQLVPITLAGKYFGVVQGIVSGNDDADVVFIVATQDGTDVKASGKDQWATTTSLNAGDQCAIQIATTGPNKAAAIYATKPVMVYHLSGSNVQKAGALIPALPEADICVGSKEVVVSRAKSYPVYLNLLAWDAPGSASSLGQFEIQVKTGGTFQPVVGGALKTLENTINAVGTFQSFVPITGVGPSPLDKWKWARVDASAAMVVNTPIRLVNKGNVFHLGILNGTSGSGNAMYGYFSDFKSFVAQAYAGGDPENPISYMPVCYSQTTQINASGGITYSWSPTVFLDNPNIANPKVINPTSSQTYTATVSGACDLTSTTSVTVEVSPPINPTLTPSTNYVCGSSSVTFTAGSLENVTKLKWYVKAPGDLDFPATPVRTDIISGIAPVDYSHTFVYPPSGDGINPVEYTLRLVASNDGCPVILESVIKVYPAVDVNPTLSFGNPNGCSPLTVNFNAGAGGIAGSYYRWEFGDGASSNINNPVHTYYNYSHINPAPYTASVTITDKHNVCTVTTTVDISVKPLVDAHFVIDPVAGCGPLVTFKATSDSKPITLSHSWYVDGVLKLIGGIPLTGTVLNQGFLHSGATSEDAESHVIRLELSSGGCSDFLENIVYVYPKAEIGTVTVTPLAGNDPKCSPLNVSFDATGIKNATSYYWQVKEMPAGAVQNVGSGTIPVTTTTLQLPSYTFTNTSNVPKVYQVSLFVNNKWGCAVSKSANITINPYVEAIAVADKEEGCPDVATGNFRVNLTNASIMPTGGRFQWTIDGVAQGWNIAVPFVDFQNNTAAQVSKVIQLTVENKNDGTGCVSNDFVTIRVNPRVTASFTATVDGVLINSASTLCSPVTVQFNGTYTNATTYSWQFGDLGASTDPNPPFILYNTGNVAKTVVVTLIASNPSGCLATATATYTVQPEIKADFSLSNSASCVPFSFNVAAPPSAATYSWEVLRGTVPFYSGTGNTPPPINVTDNKTGVTETYKVTLTASNGVCTATSPVKLVLAYPEVEAKWNLADVIPAACSPLNLNITNQSTLYSSITPLTDILWEITDGAAFNVTSINPNLVQPLVNLGYELPKNYTLKLTARSANGCTAVKTSPVVVNPPVNAAFNASVIDACTPMRIQFTDISQVKSGTSTYSWNWDGGTVVSQSGQNYLMEFTNSDPELTASKNVTLNLSNEYGCSGSASYPFTVNPRVVAAFTPSSNNICAPDDIIFQNNSTGGTLNFKWNYGDGIEENVTHRNNVTHRYENKTANPLIRTVTLTATNSIGCTNATPATVPVTIYPEIVPDFTFTIDSVCTPVKVTVTNNSLNGTNFAWNFTPTAGAPIVVNNLKSDSPFSQMLGNTLPNTDVTYTIGLTASTNHGARTCSRVAAPKTVTVLPELKLNFVAAPLAVCSDLPINFDNQSSGGTLNYTWDFNDGQSGTSTGFDDVQHIFINRDAASVTRNVTVTAVNPKGCTRKQFIPVTVHPKVEADFVFEQLSQCTPFDVRITNNSLNGNSYSWTTTYNGNRATTDKIPFTWTIDNVTSNDIQTEIIKLVSTDINTGCKDEVEYPLEVYPRVVSRFNVNRTSSCNPSTVNFSNSSSGLASYVWDFGDGSTSVDQIPSARSYSHVYKDKTQNFTIKLTATNKFGCNNVKDTTITVYPLVKTNFQWDKIEGCTPLNVNLTNTSTSALYKYRWDFGDGTSKSYQEQPTSHTFINTTNTPPVVQNPTITLRTSYVNDSTCIDSLKLPITVFPHIYPDFTANFAGCHPHNVTITNQTVSVNSSNNYFWNLGNGVNSLEVNPAIQYINTSKTKDSTFTVKLKAVSVYGCKDSITHNVIVHPRPFASMELTGEYISCPPFPVEIDNNSIGTNLTNIYTFGDGYDSTTTSMANMNHTFRNLNSSNTEPYQIKLKTVTEFGCDDSISQTVYVYPEVVAKFNANPGWTSCNPFEVTLQNTSTNSYLYRWDFDNGVTSSLPSPKHRFINLTESDKVFNVSLKATSEFDCYDDTIQRITVWATPVAYIALDPPLKVFPDATFNVYNQSQPAADDWDYSWTFSDNTFSKDKNPGTHTYHSWGPKSNDYKYNVSLVVKSPHCKDSTSSFVYLLPAIPEASFTSNIDSACAPMEVHFINASNYADSYVWEFGDGTTSTDPEPVHTYTQPGYYTVKLTVNGDGGQRFYYRIFRVYQNPKADFQVYPIRVMLPDATIHAFNTSTSFTRCLWDMGDGFQTSDRDPIHTYDKIGEFRIALWAYMDYKDKNDNTIATCIDSVSKFPAVWVEGSGLVKFPNAFKPSKISNGGAYDDLDYKNEVFHPHHYGVVEYKLMIFSRWGEQLFTTTDVKVGWDGYVNGKLAEQGVYMWRAIGKFTNGKTFDMKGSVTLLR